VDASWQSNLGTASGARILITAPLLSSEQASRGCVRPYGVFRAWLAVGPADCSGPAGSPPARVLACRWQSKTSLATGGCRSPFPVRTVRGGALPLGGRSGAR